MKKVKKSIARRRAHIIQKIIKNNLSYNVDVPTLCPLSYTRADYIFLKGVFVNVNQPRTLRFQPMRLSLRVAWMMHMMEMENDTIAQRTIPS